MTKWFRNGTVGTLYDLILICTLLITTLGGFRQGLSSTFLLGAALTASLIYLRRFSKVIKVNIVAISIIVALFTYGMEFYLTYYSKESLRIADWVKKGFDIRTNIQVYDDLQRENKSPVLVITPSILLKEGGVPEIEKEKIFPLTGISRRLTVLCNETGKWVIYNSDEHGFNNPLGQYKEGIDLLLIGDSYTHGYCVEQNQTIAANLRKKFPATISIGTGGNGELSRLASLIEYGPTLKPKMVLWIYTENTLERLWSELSNPILKNYYETDGFNQQLYDKQTLIDQALGQFLSRKIEREPRGTVVDGFDALNFVKFANLRKSLQYVLDVTQTKKSQNSNADEIEIARKILKKAKKSTESWGGKFYFVYLGTQVKSKGYVDSDHDKLIKLTQELELTTIDSFPVIEKADSLEITASNGGGHFNAEGYRLFSKVVLDSLSGN